MNIIDAVWEKRNLGVECYEITIDKKDALSDIKQTYEKLNEKEYMVIKIPSSEHEMVNYFQSKGYIFIETAITLVNNFKKIFISDSLKKLFDVCRWERADSEYLDVIEREIDKNIFKTDRISVDPFFSPGLSAQRYKFWMRDMFKSGAAPYKVSYRDKDIGFFINKEIAPGVYNGILAASYKEYEGMGMGCCVQYAGVVSAISERAEKIISHISCNNFEMLKILTSIGYNVTNIDYVFIKHNKSVNY